MGGSGGGGPFTHRSPVELVDQLRSSVDDVAIKAFETELSGILNDILASANSRDTELVKNRLEAIKEMLHDSLEATVDTLFGGSVAKHTYVDGLSDIDSLLILNETDLEGATPAAAIEKVAGIIRDSIGRIATVSHGKMAVTVEYQDGMQIQLLPAFRQQDGLKVPSFRHDGWSGISPESFQNALTSTNELCAGKLIPTVKLAKSVIAQLPESQRLSGYHIESLAIDAFKNYTGTKTVAAMLPAFFERAKTAVKNPIRDSTGQSVHVDGYMGPAGSEVRVASSHLLGRIEKRMRNASAHQSSGQWASILGLESEY